MNHKGNERGQAIVLIALAMVAVLGFAALAVDGGRVLAEKRRAQNAADSAAYAAASAVAGGQNRAAAITAGLNQASFNAFTDADAANNLGQDLDVMVYNPPIDGPYAPANISADLDPNQFYQVKIRNKVDQIFSQVVYPNGLEISAEAVAYARPAGPISAGDALVALTPHDCQGIKFHGTSQTLVNNGSIKSFSDANGSNPSCNSIAKVGGAGSVIVNNGSIISVGSQYFHDVPTITGGTQQPNVNLPPLPTLPNPVCPNSPVINEKRYRGGNVYNLSPGVYPNGIEISHKDTVVNLGPGMYCLDDDLTITGGSLIGTGVMFVMRQGSIDMSGQGSVELSRPDNLIDAAGQQWGGMLIFMPSANSGNIKITGGAGTKFYGTIYAPGPISSQDKCFIEGTSAPYSVNSSIYCYTIKIGGSSIVTVNYDAQQNYQMGASIELSQ